MVAHGLKRRKTQRAMNRVLRELSFIRNGLSKMKNLDHIKLYEVSHTIHRMEMCVMFEMLPTIERTRLT